MVQNTHDGILSVPSCFQNTSAPWLLSPQVLTNHPHPWPASNEWYRRGLRRHCCLFALIKEHHVHIYLEWEETHLITQGILFLTSFILEYYSLQKLFPAFTVLILDSDINRQLAIIFLSLHDACVRAVWQHLPSPPAQFLFLQWLIVVLSNHSLWIL